MPIPMDERSRIRRLKRVETGVGTSSDQNPSSPSHLEQPLLGISSPSHIRLMHSHRPRQGKQELEEDPERQDKAEEAMEKGTASADAEGGRNDRGHRSSLEETRDKASNPRSGKELWNVARKSLPAIVREVAEERPAGRGADAHDRHSQRHSIDSSEDSKASMFIDGLLFSLQKVRSRKKMLPHMPDEVSGELRASQDAGMTDRSQEEQNGKKAAFSPIKDGRLLIRMIFSSYMNWLLLALPAGFVAGILKANPGLVFTLNFLALLPLALILGEVTEDLALRFGDAIGGLLNATFGNAVEMILGLAALFKGLNDVVAASMIGSVLSNLLLVMGCAFFFAGFRFQGLKFNTLANKVSCSLLFLSTISVSIPTTARLTLGEAAMPDCVVRQLSRAISVLLLLLYFCYLYFQLITHKESFNATMDGEPSPCSDGSGLESSDADGGRTTSEGRKQGDAADGSYGSDEETPNENTSPICEDDYSCETGPALSLFGALGTLTFITVAVAICSEFLTGSIEEVSKATNINQSFLGLIVLPIAGNAAEHLTAVFVAVKGKMDLAISVSLGSCIQIAIFVLPLTVVVGWAGGHDFDLVFQPFAILMLTMAVILAYFVSSDGSSNWILGLFLVLDYVLVAFVFLLQKEGDEKEPNAEWDMNTLVAGANG